MNLIFTWDDIKEILRSKQHIVKKLSGVSAVIAFVFFLLSPLTYEAKATFKQSSGRGDDLIDLKNLIRTFSSGSSEGSASTLMLSAAILEKTIAELGLQAHLPRASLFQSALHNLMAEIGYDIQDEKRAQFSSLCYEGEKPLKLYLEKTSDTHYCIYDANQKPICDGIFGERLEHPQFQWMLHYLPLTKRVPLILEPLQTITHTLRKKITIKPSREDKKLLVVQCEEPDRHQAAAIVNTLMSMYEKYLVEENKLIINAQVSYLKQRQEELGAQFDHDMALHAQLLQNNLQTQGCLGIKDEIEFIFTPLQNHAMRLEEVELELRQIEQHIVKTELNTASSQPQLVEKYSQLLAHQIMSAQYLLEQVQQKKKISSSIIEELKPAIEEFNLALEKPELDQEGRTETIIADFMSQLLHREKSLMESSKWMQAIQNDLTSISLEGARQQFNHYSTQFDELHAHLKQVVFMRDHLFDPLFEISTLSNVLNDPVTQQMVQRSSDLETQLHDDLHRSSRDRERLKSMLHVHKRFLASHLDQTLQLGKIRIELVKEKLNSVYFVIKTILTQEKEALKRKMEELKQSMHQLPELWLQENRLKFKSDLTKGMMEGLIGITETKNLSHYLYQVESRPLDKAKPPLSYIKPHLFFKSCGVFILALLLFSFIAVLHAFMRGFPVSLTTLQALGEHTSGSLSLVPARTFENALDRDKDTLRRLTSFLLKEGTNAVVSVLGKKQSAFFPTLTHLLHKHGKTSCVVDCNFGKITTSEDEPGLYHILQGFAWKDTLHICPGYSFISVGTSTAWGVELLTSERFTTLLQELSSHYDFLFLLSHTRVDTLESSALIDRSTHLIVIAETPLYQLQPILEQSRQNEKKHVTFISSSS